MTKRVKNLLIIGAFIASMAVVLLLLVLTQPKADVDDEVSDSTTIEVLSYNRDDIATMTVKNSKGEFTVRNAVAGFTIDDYAEFTQNSTTMGAMGRCVTQINARALVEENAQDLAKYGLSADAPEAQCEVTLKDGTNYTVYFGINAPDGSTRYFRLADSNDVYTVLLNSSSYFYYDSTDFISLVVTDELTNNNTAPTIDWMTVTRKDLDYDIRFEDDTKNYAVDEVSMASSQVMISPVYAYLDISNSNAIIYGMWGLTASDVICVHPTEEDLEKYGLADPFCTVNIDAELQNYHLDIGNVASYQLDNNGEPTSTPAEYYCIYRGIDIIYTFASSEVPWASFMPIDIISSMMTGNLIYNLDYIDIDYYADTAASYHFDIVGDEDAATVDVKLNGAEYVGDDFKELYKFILWCPNDDICLDDPGDAPLIARMELHCTDGDRDIVEFYDTGANRVTVKLNGVTSYSQPISYLNVLQQNIEKFMSGASGDELQTVW